MKKQNSLLIGIQNQEEFNILPDKIIESIKEGLTNITVEFKNTGPYYYNESFLFLNNIKNDELSIVFNGPSDIVTLRPKSIRLIDGEKTDINPTDVYRSSFTTIDETYPTAKKHGFFKKIWEKICKWWRKLWKINKQDKVEKYKPYYNSMWGTDLYTTSSLIEVVDEKTKECRLIYDKLADICNIDGDVKDKAWIHVLQWFKSGYYPITKIDLENNSLYFTCTDLLYDSNKKTWSINNDYKFSKGEYLPMFRLANVGAENAINIIDGIVHLPEYINSVDASLATNFISLQKSDIKKISFKNISFEGSACNPKIPTLSLITTDTVTAKEGIIFENCEFLNIHSNCAIRTYRTQNVIIKHCNFIDCWQYGIFANEGKDHIINNNHFKYMGLSKSNNIAIRIDCENFDVSYNYIQLFGYSAIATGTWWGSFDYRPNIGNISNNILIDGTKDGNLLMDSGAIYVYTQNTDVKIHDNIIIGHTGRKENRGIFCDDGAGNFSLYWNYITNTPNTYSIDARRVRSVEVSPTTQLTKPANTGSQIHDNIIDGPIKFEGNEKYVGNKEEPEKRNLLGPNYGFGAMTSTDHKESIMKNVEPLEEGKELIMFADSDKYPQKAKDILNTEKRDQIMGKILNESGTDKEFPVSKHLKSEIQGTDHRFIG